MVTRIDAVLTHRPSARGAFRARPLLVACALSLAACSGAGVAATPFDASGDTARPDARKPTPPKDAGADAASDARGMDAARTPDAPFSVNDANEVADSAEAASPATDAPSGDGGAYDPPIDTTTITGLTSDAWIWVPLAGAICRDGSGTGIGVNVHAGSTNLMIYLEGGGSCDEAKKCAPCVAGTDQSADGGVCTPLDFGASEFATFAGGSHAGSIFDRSLATNPVKDWNLVYVPYCTGDQHGGNALGVDPPDYTVPQDFVGYVDVALALARLVPTFPAVTEVLLSGESAGGAGVELNYLQTARAFAGVRVDALDDSGPPMPTPYLAACQQSYLSQLFRYDRTWIQECGADCQPSAFPDGGGAIGLTEHMAALYPASSFGVLDSMWDSNISANYGAGNYDGMLNDCAGLAPDAGFYRETQAMFGAGQLAIRTAMAAYPNFGTFLFPGSTHTTIGRTAAEETMTDKDFADRTTSPDAGAIPVTTWVGSLVNGTVTNAGP